MIALPQLSIELRAVRDAETAMERAELKLIQAYAPSQRAFRAAARSRFATAQRDLQTALARLQKKRAEVSGDRHLELVKNDRATHY